MDVLRHLIALFMGAATVVVLGTARGQAPATAPKAFPILVWGIRSTSNIRFAVGEAVSLPLARLGLRMGMSSQHFTLVLYRRSMTVALRSPLLDAKMFA